ncbi:tonB-system energizer ExbB [Devosia sp. 2618]|uniref:tonB-system energizer ExbB n=1 Tax=Devosia sp. 2618 TaxID=3156454 RepID=UPI003398D2C7
MLHRPVRRPTARFFYPLLTAAWLGLVAAPSAQEVPTTPAPVVEQQPEAVEPPTPAPAETPAPVEVVTPDAPATAPEPTVYAVPSAALPHDLSPYGMYMQADWVVKGVMIGLAVASLVTWTILVAKILELAGAKRRVRKARSVITGSRTLDDAVATLGKRRGIGALLLSAAKEELEMTGSAATPDAGDGLKERVSSRLRRIELAAGRRISRGTGILATVGSVSPFVGLFGTVWGIMNSFISISESQTTNLAIVAPGIAEALLATAIGLVAAIPAVVIYNAFSRAIAGYRQLLGDAASGVERLVSRDLDATRTAGGN